ncbi:hypothetical protein [Agrobacterium tumefaciens]|uniref:hypothetical protein n=1 Tax=Agrobacterium tumefaciens TaxID=358 RepID=UPI00285A306B|nr:hypothetical protein [Agrobacterium tumefaciens]MDR6586873.1 ketol-acid reductoisomerase [Agrobacterium tumefaciens]
MKNKIEALRARMDGAQSKGAKSMWYMLFADAVADRLCEAETITRQDMKAIFERRLNEVRDGPEARLLVPGYEECLTRLDEFIPKNNNSNGYEPSGL